MKATLVLIGADKLGRRLVSRLEAQGTDESIVMVDAASPRRMIRLLRRSSLPPKSIFHMALANLKRRDFSIGSYPTMNTLDRLADQIRTLQPARVVCYRVGLIIDRKTLRLGPAFLNVHCADLPRYAGLGAIARALDEGAYDQHACLHEMVAQVDGGSVLEREPYRLDPLISYGENEDRAYAAGEKLLMRFLNASERIGR